MKTFSYDIVPNPSWVGRIGETDSKEVDVRFVFASNEPPKSFGLEKDLLARLMVIEIPPLKERPADIPGIFDRLLHEAQLQAGVSLQLTRESVRASQYETLMLDGFEEDNVRGLIKIADAIATRASTGLQPEIAIDEIFDELYNTQYGSSRDAGFGELKFTKEIEKADNKSSNKVSDIEATYYKHGENVAAIRRELTKKGINHSRRKIAKLLDQLKLPRIRKPRK
ncbi:MAG: hypothetical protein GY832_36610 [Chloroflexi bacterium]|nr:hypothetical protein [Chloroflexota bacterium]